jgi:acyl carrier protein
MENQITGICASHFAQIKPSTMVTNTTRLVEELGMDSIDIIESTMIIEEAIGICLPDNIIDIPLRTIGDIIYLVEKARNQVEEAVVK